MDSTTESKFLSPETIAEILSVEVEQVHDLIESGELLAIRVGVNGPWRVEQQMVEQFISDAYAQSQTSLRLGGHNTANVYDLADGRLI